MTSAVFASIFSVFVIILYVLFQTYLWPSLRVHMQLIIVLVTYSLTSEWFILPMHTYDLATLNVALVLEPWEDNREF